MILLLIVVIICLNPPLGTSLLLAWLAWCIVAELAGW